MKSWQDAPLDWHVAADCNAEHCVEVAATPGGQIAVRDTKEPDGPVLVFTEGEWRTFIEGAKRGEFDALGAAAQ